jgi:centromere-localized protein 2
MAPTEASILENYLLSPGLLPSIVTLEQFAAFFPGSLETSPQVRALYRDLQQQRNEVVDAVSQAIANEAKRGKSLRRDAIRARREGDSQIIDDETEIEKAVGALLWN